MSEYQTELDSVIHQDGSDRIARVCSIIRATAMCVAAIVPIALLAGARHGPAHRGEDPTLIKSVLQTRDARPAVTAWIGVP